MEKLNILEIIDNMIDELSRAREIIGLVVEDLNDELKDFSGEDGDANMLCSDIDTELERVYDLKERIDFAMLMSACVGDVAIPTVYDIYELEAKTELPYNDAGLVDTEEVYNTIDDIVADLLSVN